MRATIRDPYPVYIGAGLLEGFDFKTFGASSFVVITDSNVDKLLFSRLQQNHSLKQYKTHKIVIPAGEQSKTLSQAEHILRHLAKNAVDRETIILALGGGVIGDLTGLVAALYKRGVRYVQIPTTLLAQVDSSLGGKTAVNLPEAKNMVGITKDPVAVITDLTALNSLTPIELQNGYSEIIKYGMIFDKKLFAYLEKHIDEPDIKVNARLVKTSARIKLSIARKDPNEKEYRKILNYGHTVGHALETSSDHSLSHGQAVALGMIAEGFIANKKHLLSKKSMDRQNRLIEHLKLPKLGASVDNNLIELMRRDKKSKLGELYFVLPKSVGKVKQKHGQVAFAIEESLVLEALEFLTDFVNQAK